MPRVFCGVDPAKTVWLLPRLIAICYPCVQRLFRRISQPANDLCDGLRCIRHCKCLFLLFPCVHNPFLSPLPVQDFVRRAVPYFHRHHRYHRHRKTPHLKMKCGERLSFFVLSSIISIVPKIKSKTVNIIVQYIQMCGKIKNESVYLQMAKHK